MLIIAGLFSLAAGLLHALETRVPAALIFCAGLPLLWKWFVRAPKKDTELPCAAVSCCHYLDNNTDATQAGKKDIPRR